ncbi:MAG TPA: translation elongation factor Ts [Tepidisphaeraceae bacterium]|jgi:elongation factor Ts
MAEITAKLVNELRARTGQGMMECKKMLQEMAGDLEKAIEGFRKKGIKSSLAERAATEGRVIGLAAEDGKAAALVEINCNTDFTAKSAPFLQLGANAAKHLLHNPNTDIAQAANVNANITEVSQQTGENVRVGRTAYLSNPGGKVGLYLYAVTGKIGVIMSFGGNPTAELITDIGGHIAYSNPLAHTREQLPADVVAKEKDFAVEQAKATGKPQNIAEKIAEGKLGSFFKERVLLDQDFFNAQKFKGTIQELLKSQNVTLEKYVRIEVGK